MLPGYNGAHTAPYHATGYNGAHTAPPCITGYNGAHRPPSCIPGYNGAHRPPATMVGQYPRTMVGQYPRTMVGMCVRRTMVGIVLPYYATRVGMVGIHLLVYGQSIPPWVHLSPPTMAGVPSSARPARRCCGDEALGSSLGESHG